MILIYISILILTVLIEYVRTKRFFSPSIIFTFMWTVFPGISSLGLYGMIKPTLTVHTIVIATVLTFNFVYFMFLKRTLGTITETINDKINYNLIIILNAISLLYLTTFIPSAFRIIRDYGFSYLRDSAFESSFGLGTTYELIIISWIVQAVIIATVIYGVIYSIIMKKHLLLVLGIIGVVIYTVLFGGRYMLVRLMFYYVSTFIIAARNFNKKKLKFKKRIIVIPFILVFIVSVLRSSDTFNFVRSTIIYYSGPFAYLSDLIATAEFTGNYLYGTATTGFIYNIIIAPFSLLFGIEYAGSNQIITQITSQVRYIGNGLPFNAMSTMIYPFIFDFGLYGFIISVILLALTTIRLDNSIRRGLKPLNFAIYLFFLFTLFDSVMSYQLLFPTAGFTLLFIMLFSLKVTK